MKKLALIGMVVAGLLLSTSVALSKPTGLTPGEIQASITRSQAMHLKYGDYEYAQPALSQPRSTKLSAVNQKLEEIGAWAVPTKRSTSTPIDSTVASGGRGFDWNDAGIGAALALAGVLGIGAVLTVRHQHQHTPIPH